MKPNEYYCYSIENVLEQARAAPFRLGFYELHFYTENGRPSKQETGTVEVFYFYPSGGTIRDSHMNIVFYEPRLDLYRDMKGSL